MVVVEAENQPAMLDTRPRPRPIVRAGEVLLIDPDRLDQDIGRATAIVSMARWMAIATPPTA